MYLHCIYTFNYDAIYTNYVILPSRYKAMFRYDLTFFILLTAEARVKKLHNVDIMKLVFYLGFSFISILLYTIQII